MAESGSTSDDDVTAKIIREILESRLTPSWSEYVRKLFRGATPPDELSSVQELVERLYADGFLDPTLTLEVLTNVDRFALSPPPIFIQRRPSSSASR
jgi:hypothetical protein